MVKRLLPILFLAVMANCTPATPLPSVTPTIPPTQEATPAPPIRYLALGDSYTIGELVSERDRWPNQLAALIEASPQFQQKMGEGEDIHVRIIARTGWTADDLWRGMQANPPSGTYDMVSLLIGVNDQFRGLPLDGYREDFRFLLGKAVEFAGGNPKRVIVLSIPDWGFTPFAAVTDTELISQQIDEFNAVVLEETEAAAAHFVDVTVISRMAMDDFELVTGDRLHPSGKMYALWADKIVPIALEILFPGSGE
jgi:lysophospholipase L1-like esterase